MSHIGHRFGPLIFTTCHQGGGAPWIDRATTRDAEGNLYSSLAILSPRALTTRQYDRKDGTAWVLGLRTDWSRRLRKLAHPLIWCFARWGMRSMIFGPRRQLQSLTSFALVSEQGYTPSPSEPRTESSTPDAPSLMSGPTAPADGKHSES